MTVTHSQSKSSPSESVSSSSASNSSETGPLAQVLAEKLSLQLSISSQDWHRLKSNRRARALEQAAAAIVFLLKDQPQEALIRFQQAVGWLDRSISAPPCPTHGQKDTGTKDAIVSHQSGINSQALDHALNHTD
jgi:Family of unknown function (DUF6439)